MRSETECPGKIFTEKSGEPTQDVKTKSLVTNDEPLVEGQRTAPTCFYDEQYCTDVDQFTLTRLRKKSMPYSFYYQNQYDNVLTETSEGHTKKYKGLHARASNFMSQLKQFNDQ